MKDPRYKISEKPLFSAEELRNRIQKLGYEVETTFQPEIVVGILTGVFIFIADLVRTLNPGIRIVFIRASSYGNGCQSGSKVLFSGLERLNIEGKRVLMVDDILDSGHTLFELNEKIQAMHPAAVKTCVLLDKPSRREVTFDADFKGFEIENRFVVGYGLDYADMYRTLPAIYTLEPSDANVD